MYRTALKLFVAVLGAVALSNCYGAKMVKGPVNSDRIAKTTDTLLVQQRDLLARIEAMEMQLAREGQERTEFQARTSVTLNELNDAVQILTSRIDDGGQSNNNRSGRDQGSRPSTGMAAADSAAAAAEELYRGAYMDVSRGNYDLAAQAFQDYLTRYPTGSRAAESHYYLGECHYANERYLEAAGEFQRLVREFPTARQAPAAYLKMGRAYQELEERGLAEKAFQSLIDKHPKSEEARQAQSALQELRG